MSQTLKTAIAVVGVDIGKNSFHIVGLDQRGPPGWGGALDLPNIDGSLFHHALGPSQLAAWYSNTVCLIKSDTALIPVTPDVE
jgi:hypothetical protein